MDQNIVEAVKAYDQADKSITDLEAQLEQARQNRNTLAANIAREFGNGPHNVGDRLLIVAKSRGQTFYLRPPIRVPGSKVTTNTAPKTKRTKKTEPETVVADDTTVS